jgi:magnesium-transporting ATPase (P-type)
MFCDKTGTLTENKMIFKKCTIGGCDYAHNSFTRSAESGAIRTDDLSTVNTHQSGRAIIPVNPVLSERLNSIDLDFHTDRTDTTMKMEEQVTNFGFYLTYLPSLTWVPEFKLQPRQRMCYN